MIKRMSQAVKKLSHKKGFLFGLIIVTVYILPYILFWEENTIQIHDNLDSFLVHYKIVVESNNVFSANSEIVEPMMGGLPRSVYPSEFNVIMLLFVIFPPLTAYILNIVFIHFIAFIGMYALLTYQLSNIDDIENIIVGVSICFAILPFYPWIGLSVAGLPFALNSFLKKRHNATNISDWLVIFILPFYSNFVLTGLFFLIIIGLLGLYDVIRLKSISLSYFAMMLIMMSIYLMLEIRNFNNFIGGFGFTSHRIEFENYETNPKDSLLYVINIIFHGQYHAASFPCIIMMIMFAIVVFSLFRKFVGGSTDNKEVNMIKGIFVTLLAIGIWTAVFRSILFFPIKKQFVFIRIFQWDRFYTLQPLLVYLGFALMLGLIQSGNGIPMSLKKMKLKYRKILVNILIIMQFILILTSANSPNYYHYYGSIQTEGDETTFQEFYDPKLFSMISESINRPKDTYRVVSLGLHPSISLYNGFYTLDGYITNYPLEYKIEFRNIIERELEKNDKIKAAYDKWGSRVYLFSAELGYKFHYTKLMNKTIKNFEINTSKLIEMGGEFIISAVNIGNYPTLNLTLVDIYEHEESIWRIYLYQIH